MIRRMIPAASLLSLAACQPYTYPQYSSDNAYLYTARAPSPAIPVGVPVWASTASPDNAGPDHRTAQLAPAALVTPAAVPPAVKPRASVALAVSAPDPVSLERCRSSVSFSGAPTRKPPAIEPLIETAEYGYEQGGYSEKAACTCKRDFDYTQVSQFDAVDNVRRHAAERGFVLQKASFGQAPEQGRALDYEAASEREAGGAFLVGRTFYGHCSLSVAASGVSYADLQRAKKFIASVTAQKGEEVDLPGAAISDATITAASPQDEEEEGADSGSTAPPAVPATPVAIADVSHAPKAKAEDASMGKAEEPAAAPIPAAGDTAAPPATAAASAPPSPDVVVDRLRRLKLLLEQKLITPAEYEAKRKAVIDTL